MSTEAFEGLLFAAMARWTGGKNDGDYVESWPDFRRRCVEGLLVLAESRSFETLVVFTSGGVVAAICQHALGLPDAAAVALCRPLLNCGVTRLLHHSNRLHLSTLNSVAHLEGAESRRLLTYR